MSVQQNKNFNFYTDDQIKVLDLEKKYFNILYKIFFQQSFKNELIRIMEDINKDWKKICDIWDKENHIDLAVERHINYKIYTDPLLEGVIDSIYPSPISSDTAFVTKDAVINIDSKTVNVKKNFNDWPRQTVGCNQMSFDNKLNFHAPNKKIHLPITSHLAPYYDYQKPVLSFFLSTLYHIDEKKEKDSWYIDSDHYKKPYYDSKAKDKTKVKDEYLKNIKFACMPHRSLSDLFEYRIVDGVKSYKPPGKNVTPTGTDSVRIAHESLENRYDSNGNYWKGFKSWIIE